MLYSTIKCVTWCVKFISDLPGDVSEEPVMEKLKNGWRMRCDVGEVTEGLENVL